MNLTLHRHDRVVLIGDPKGTIGTIIHCKGKLAEVKWVRRARVHTHRKISLAKVGTDGGGV